MTENSTDRSTAQPVENSIDPTTAQPAENIATLQAKVEELKRRNEALEETHAPAHHWGGALRAVAVVVLVCLGALLATASVPTIWARNLILNTDRYVQTLDPLASNAGLQRAVVQAVEEQFTRNVDVSAIVAQTLPPRAAATLAGPIQAGAASLVSSVTTKFVESDVFRNLWSTVNRAAHTALVAVLTGRNKENAAVAIKNGVLYLNLAPIISQVKVRLVDAGLAIAAKVPTVGATIELLEVKGLAHAQSLVRTLDNLAIWLPILALVCFVAAIAISTRHRRTTIASALAVALGMLIIALGIVVGRRVYLDQLPLKYMTADDAGGVFDTLVRYLRDGLRIIFVVSLLICAIAWITSGGDRARKTRAHFRTAAQTVAARGGDSPAMRAIAANRRTAAIVLFALAALVLVLWTNPGLLTVVLILAVTAALVGIVYSLGAPVTERDAGPRLDGAHA